MKHTSARTSTKWAQEISSY